MRVRLGFGLHFDLLVERKELREEALWRGFGLLIELKETKEAYRLLIVLRQRKRFRDVTFKIFFYSI